MTSDKDVSNRSYSDAIAVSGILQRHGLGILGICDTHSAIVSLCSLNADEMFQFASLWQL